MKFLYVTTVGGTMRFFKTLIEELINAGHTVDIATHENNTSKVPAYYHEWGCKVYQINTSRSPLDKGNLIAIKQIKKIVQDGQYDIVHCHTPIAAACTRLACRSLRKKGTKVIYTAHGFHFYKGAPLKNWLLYYPVEKLCAHMTDVLITINTEDYALAQKKLNASCIEYVPGVGVDVESFAGVLVDRDVKRDEIGVPRDAFVLLSVGELNENKNHKTVIRALAMVDDPTIHYVIAGKGAKKEYLENLAKELNVNLHLLGYRRDIAELDKISDVFVLPSYREGLNVSTMEAMSSGLPVLCGNIRGNRDLVDNKGGYLFDPCSITECQSTINCIRHSDVRSMGEYNINKIKAFAYSHVHSLMMEIYNK